MKTAVEWFNEEINKLNVGIDARMFIAKLFEKAKELEKQQIIDAYIDGHGHWGIGKNAEHYYNETFKSE